MKKLFAGILSLLCFYESFTQGSLQSIRRKSWIVQVYKISADTAQKYLEKGIVSIDHYLNQAPVACYSLDSGNREDLPIGNYLEIYAIDNEIVADFFCRTNLQVYVINNNQNPQVLVKDERGMPVTISTMWVKGKKAKLNPATGIHKLQQHNPGDVMARIETAGDTCFTNLSFVDEDRVSGIGQQRWRRVQFTTMGRLLLWLPNKITHFIKNKPRRWFPKRYRYNGEGFMVFNQPKYKLTDTVKLKAYILNKKKKPSRATMQVSLGYSSRGKYVEKELAKISPATPGSYMVEFALSDTLPNDANFTIRFRDRNGKNLANDNFKTEDYLLDEVARYDVKSSKQSFVHGDTIQFTANASDANSLPLLDGKVKLYLITRQVKKFYPNFEIVPDTLWQEEKPLAVDGDTKFAVPTSSLPQADLQIEALAAFRNSNNEIQEKSTTIYFNSEPAFIQVNEEQGRLGVTFYQNGKPRHIEAFIKTSNAESEKKITIPASLPIDPMVESYEIYTKTREGLTELSVHHKVAEWYKISYSRFQKEDSVGFFLHNPYQVPVYYSLFEKDNIIAQGAAADEWIRWIGKLTAGKQYVLKWQYYWAGQEHRQSERLALYSKLLDAGIQSRASVYPGQIDTITVNVRDYKGRPAASVNLAAFSYNSQFGNDIDVATPPYMERFKRKLPLSYPSYQMVEAEATRKFPLGMHKKWTNLLGLDSMIYYKLLLPSRDHHIVKTRVENIVPQVAVHVVENGHPQEIYLLYLNRRLVYYNGTNGQSVYAFSEFPGFVQIGIRLKDKYIQTDSIYLQPYYKHDIIFDIGKLHAKVVQFKMPDYWTDEERKSLNEKVLRIENNYRNNYGYTWQGDRFFYLNGQYDHVLGPFESFDSIQFYKPGDFDFKFQFEPGYRYRVTPKMVRLEKKDIFNNIERVYLPDRKASWRLGDTILQAPVISYKKIQASPFLNQYGNNGYSRIDGKSSIYLIAPKDSSIAYTILHQEDTSKVLKVLLGAVQFINNLDPGKYRLMQVTRSWSVIESGIIEIDKTGIYCLRFDKSGFKSHSPMLDLLFHRQDRMRREAEERINYDQRRSERESKREPHLTIQSGNGIIRGVITDQKGGDVIPHVSVHIKGTRTGVATSNDGQFVLSGIRPGKYKLVISAVGYSSVEKEVDILGDGFSSINVALEPSVEGLSEVVVVGYGVTRRAMLTGSVTRVSGSELNVLTGKVSGLLVSNDRTLTLRGIRSITDNAVPLLIVDGVVVPEMPSLDSFIIASITVLKGNTAVSLYGPNAANGAIVITTKGFDIKSVREKFRDYAFWHPNLFTDRDGKVKFAVTYPDNITSWQTFVVGMDKKNRIVSTSSVVRAFKPVQGILSTPQFLREGDSLTIVGKKMNYTKDEMAVNIDFTVNGILELTQTGTLDPGNASISYLPIQVPADADTMHVKFTLKSASGFADGEIKKIPVERRGTAETRGDFFVLEGDTVVSFRADENAGRIKVMAVNNTLDIMLDEIEHLKDYPFYCMEQTASKLTGLAMEKKIRTSLNEKFTSQVMINKLVEKLHKGQMFEGGWGWWGSGSINLHITNYITRALLQLRGEEAIEPMIRNSLLFLQNRLNKLEKSQLIESLYTLSEAGHYMDYSMFLKKIPFDSLDEHRQWQLVSIKTKQGLNPDRELKYLFSKGQSTMLGGLHWGKDQHTWYNNTIATTVLAYQVLERDGRYHKELIQIIQYFLEQRRAGYWRNTVESASVLSAILPTLLNEKKNFRAPASISLTGDTSMSIQSFPYKTTMPAHVKQFEVSKSGGGMVYFTAYQQIFNSRPHPVEKHFRISSRIQGQPGMIMKAGEKAKLQVTIEVLRDAEYVQIEIPIPAGCTYAHKSKAGEGYHEYFKNKLMVFVENMPAGSYSYEIELEPRYSGRFTLNPAKAELMYFPVFYGRGKMDRVEIMR